MPRPGIGEEAVQFLNAGVSPGASVPRFNADTGRLEGFNVFGAKAIALIDLKLSDALESRLLKVRTRKLPPSERVEKLRHREDYGFLGLKRDILRWALDNKKRLAQAEPDMPESLHDRDEDRWWSIYAVAELAGAEWRKRASEAVAEIEGARTETSFEVRLLHAVWAAFEAIRARVSSRRPTS